MNRDRYPWPARADAAEAEARTLAAEQITNLQKQHAEEIARRDRDIKALFESVRILNIFVEDQIKFNAGANRNFTRLQQVVKRSDDAASSVYTITVPKRDCNVSVVHKDGASHG